MTNRVLCPNCGSEIKQGFISSVDLLSNELTAVINRYQSRKSAGYCTECTKQLAPSSIKQFKEELNSAKQQLSSLAHKIPVVTLQTPYKWEYEVLGMVTGQSTIGTGVITEFTSTFTDAFGGQSSRHNKKIKDGENLCLAQLRKQAIELGGNAVIGADIDYSEMGSLKGMIMVCMAGTAIRLNNTEILGPENKDALETIQTIGKKYVELDKMDVAL